MSDNVAHALAGAGGGILSMALTYPLVNVSMRSSVQAKQAGGKPVSQIDVAKNVVKEEGVAGLYSGVESALYGVALTNGIYYYFYEAVKAAFESAAGVKRAMTTFESMASGAVAGAATAIATNPVWVVNTRLAVRKDTLDETTGEKKAVASKSTFQAAQEVYREEGIQGFFKGVVPALILVINPIIQYTVFEQLKAWIEKSRKLTNWDFFWLGAVSKLAATGTTYPYIVVKQRMQLKQGTDEKTRYSSVLDGFQKILKYEGVGGFYKGLESKLMQSILTAAFLFMSKEILFEYAVRLLVMLGARPKPAPIKQA
ncbi:mitochondrial carrier domain-containing protein [Hyaloraphidium curvatum]|nr:mitochondrial carrier domain-containing protein [Hyaloraphidium curvatum]